MSSRIPAELSLAWFAKKKNREIFRDQMRYVDQHRGALVVTPSGAIRPGQYSHQSENVVYDLRDVETSAEPAPIIPPVLAVAEDDPNQELDVTWTLPDVYDELYLERSEDQVTWVVLATLAGNATSYDDAAVTVGVTEYYRIRGRVGGAYSAYSNIDSGMLVAPAAGFELFATGSNDFSNFGEGTTTSVESFAQIGVVDTWAKIEGTYYHSAAIRDDGTLWTCGRNTSGQGGHGDLTSRTTWTQVGAGTDWTHVKCGQFFTIARKSNGTLWVTGNLEGWGGPASSGTELKVFTQIGTDTDWSGEFCCGYFHVLAIKSGGTLWAFGVGNFGPLAQGNDDDEIMPVQIGSATNWTKVAAGESHSAAINSAGELWGSGLNSDGQLGTGDYTDVNVMTQSAGTTFSKVACGQYHTVVIKTDGTLWATGYNANGQLGRGNTTTHFNTFAQLGALTTWAGVSCGTESTMAIKTTGEIFGCGSNFRGNIGDGTTTTSQTTLVQESTGATDWAEVVGCYRATFALKPP